MAGKVSWRRVLVESLTIVVSILLAFWLQAWWDFIDPFIAMKEFVLLYVATVLGLIVEVIATVGMWVFGIYIYGWHVLPVVIDTLF